MYKLFLLLLLLYTYAKVIPARYDIGRSDGIKFCVENPQKCKTEYQQSK